jgi:hypothetical protein
VRHEFEDQTDYMVDGSDFIDEETDYKRMYSIEVSIYYVPILRVPTSR